MPSAPSPVKRLLLRSLWVVLPFGVLLVLSWSAWRSDAEIRRTRSLEAARGTAERALDAVDGGLGDWSEVPKWEELGAPPLPDRDPLAASARTRYDAGDFEGVLGSPESVRSAAGVPLRALAALQLLRRETDPVRLNELSAILTRSLDFSSPPFLEEAGRRFEELKIPLPPPLANWRERWQRGQTEATLAQTLAKNDGRTFWLEHDGQTYLIERDPNSRGWRIHTEPEVAEVVSAVLAGKSPGVADGLGLRVSVGGKTLAGSAGRSRLAIVRLNGWKCEVVVADEVAFLRDEVRTRNFMTAVISVAGLAVAFGLVQSGRAYLRAVELARRQGEFMAAVSHEMRTPLAAMRLLAENLESGVADRAGQSKEHIRMIRGECARLGDLVGNVLAFTRRDAPPLLEPFDIKALMFDVDALMRPLAEAGQVALETRVEAFPETPFGDAEALRRAFVNLADNALKHSPAGSSVRCHAAPAGEGKWLLKVTDHGPGVPAREQKKIFEPFYRIGDELRRTTPGTGLGLALVKRTATAHGGNITVSDTPGGGACFTLTLPLIPP